MNRRQFLGGSIRGTAGITLGMAALARSSTRVLGANEKVVLGLIGAGGRGSLLIEGMTEDADNVETKYVCEVDSTRGHGTIRNLEEIQGYAPKRVIDMREVLDDKDVDAVVIATPGQWHALATVWACQAGKDVYVEKCISMSIWEGRKMIEAARKYNRVVQCGTQNRSMPESISARDYVKSGKMGKIVHITVNTMHEGGRWRPKPDSDPPEGFDWDRWLGPAPEVPYNENRHREYPNYWDYSGGLLARTGCHTLDLARMVIGDPPHPKSVYAVGGRIAFNDERETPDMAVATYDYGDFTMTMEHAEFMPYMTRTIYTDEVCYGDEFPYWPQCSTRI
ncbi:MAG: Gfo/Idh/MocA family oxidoreductase, partial [Candidatus Hydrogenedentes bacterium]|nr:Gfo/Idh/MocA family oxidoreductase [Candidatus Hydrogenedentota bacterium]